MSENYLKLKQPPKNALREIQAGDLKGKTDINPQWRYEIMDEIYGECGKGWTYEIVKLWDYPTQDGTVLCFAQVNVFIIDANGKTSYPIPGLGGNTLVDMVKGYNAGDPKRAKPNDEGYKMAITDALSTALKLLGVGADIYRGLWDGTKYKDKPTIDTTDPITVKTKDIEIEKQTVILEGYITSGIISGKYVETAQTAINSCDLENINKWITWAKKQEAGN